MLLATEKDILEKNNNNQRESSDFKTITSETTLKTRYSTTLYRPHEDPYFLIKTAENNYL